MAIPQGAEYLKYDSDIMDRYNTPLLRQGMFKVVPNLGNIRWRIGTQFRHYATDFKVHESNGTLAVLIMAQPFTRF